MERTDAPRLSNLIKLELRRDGSLAFEPQFADLLIRWVRHLEAVVSRQDELLNESQSLLAELARLGREIP